MWDKIKEIYAGAFLILSAGWILVHLLLIEVFGVVRINEPRGWILWIEIAFTIGIIILGVERLIADFRRLRNNNEN